jgi:hypothetical protein
MPMQKTKRVIFPVQQIDVSVGKLQRDLRRIRSRYMKGELGKLQAQTLGEYTIKQVFNELEVQLRSFINSHGLLFDGDRQQLEQGLQETLERWRHIFE